MVDQPLFPGLPGLDKHEALASSKGNGTSTAAVAPKPALPDLFGESATPKGPASEGSNVVNAVVSQSEAGNVRILGPQPTLNPNIEIPGSTFSFGRLLFQLSILAALVTFGFFYSQLQTRFEVFEKNPAQQFVALEASVQEEQTTLNLYHWTLAKYALDDFSVAADHYLYQLALYESEWTSRNEKTLLETELSDLQETMKDSLAVVQENMAHPIYPEEFGFSDLTIPELDAEYTALFLARMEADKQTLLTKEGGPYTTDISTLDSVLNLFNHADLRNTVRAVDLEADLSKETVQTLFEDSMEVSTSEFLTVLMIKNQREDWNNLLQTIESLTSRVDPLYESNLPSYIEYSNMSFDAETGVATLRGETRTDDSLNFSVISDLIDELEASTLFMDVTTRSFSKTENDEDGYAAQFILSMTLQEGADSRDDTTPVTSTVPTTPSFSEATVPEEDATTTTEPTEETAESSAEITAEDSLSQVTETLEAVSDVVAETGAALIQVFRDYGSVIDAKGEFLETVARLNVHREESMTVSSRVSRTPIQP